MAKVKNKGRILRASRKNKELIIREPLYKSKRKKKTVEKSMLNTRKRKRTNMKMLKKNSRHSRCGSVVNRSD